MDYLKLGMDILLLLFGYDITVKDVGSGFVFGINGVGYELNKSIEIIKKPSIFSKN